MEYDGMKQHTVLKAGLRAWTERHEISINDFRKAMNYTYAYSWDLLRGKAKFTTSTYGRFVAAYGLAAGQELMQLAGYPTELPRPEEAQPVPVVYIEGKKD